MVELPANDSEEMVMKKELCLTLAAALLAVGCSQAERQDLTESANRGLAKAERAVDNSVSTAKIKSALMASPKLDASKINVDSDKNVVYLRGSVPSVEQKALATRLATDMVEKNQQVVDELKVAAAANQPSAQ